MSLDLAVEPFQIKLAEEVLVDLKRRLTEVHWPDEVVDAGWDYGTPLGYLKELCEYWPEGFDWREQERRLNAFEHYKASIDGLTIHFVHARADQPDAIPLIATHGWPSTLFELLELIPRLTKTTGDGPVSGSPFCAQA
jgi:epoxide hydrolase